MDQMIQRSKWTLVSVTVTALLLGFGATTFLARAAEPGGGGVRPDGAGTRIAPPAARTSLPGLAPATGGPTLPGFETVRPSIGTVARVPGPFDERYSWSHLQLADGRVTGNLTVTSDVSDLLELEVLVGWYDARGQLLGIRSFVRHHTLHEDSGSGVPDESQRVVVDVPQQLRRTAVAAAVGVPVLVNE